MLSCAETCLVIGTEWTEMNMIILRVTLSNEQKGFGMKDTIEIDDIQNDWRFKPRLCILKKKKSDVTLNKS